MGSSAGSRRGRARWRALASFVSFVLLFGFALGQGSSWLALAEGEGTAPVTEEEAPADDAAAEEAPRVDEPAEGVGGEAPAEETAAGGDGSVAGDAPGTDPGDAVGKTAPAAADAAAGSGDDARSQDGSTGSEAVEPTAQEPDTPGAPSGDGVQPVLLTGNQNCADVFGDSLLFEYRHDPVVDATIDLADESDGDVQGMLEIDVDGLLFDFAIEDGDPVTAVIVKGGDNANLFDYRPGGNLADTNLHAPLNSNNNQFHGLSHISFCWAEVPPVPGIDVEKTCPATVASGEDITYTITVRNTGNEDLENLEVNDLLLGGDITADFDFPDPFEPGDEASAQFTHSPGGGDDQVENSVTASGDGVESGDPVNDTADCTTTVEQPNPLIDVTKECTGLAHVGDAITYTITVTNTGDEDLTGITVDDSVLGPLSAEFADELAVGASETQQFQHVVSASDDDPLVNVVTVTGSGMDSEASAQDVAQCQTDVLNPAISIVKTVDEELVPVGTTVTYTYLVTNTGDTTLYDVSVDDDVLGHIGDIAVLEPGQSVTLTADFVVGDAIVTNVAIAEGEDILGRSVSADDDAVVSPIAGENPPPPTEPPFTGSDAGRLGLIALALFGIGVTVVAATRRRRPVDAA